MTETDIQDYFLRGRNKKSAWKAFCQNELGQKYGVEHVIKVAQAIRLEELDSELKSIFDELINCEIE